MLDSSLLSDPDLAARIRRRDREALAAVADAYLDQIVRAARGSGLNQDQAEEVAQNTFTTFIETASRFEGRSHVRTWIFGILYRKIQESRRGFAKDRRMDDIDEVFESRFSENQSWSRPPRGPDKVLFAKEARHEINGCLETLPDRQRDAFVLREVEALSTEEICKILDVSTTNIGVMLFRARNRLRECLETKWEQT
ncbi:MAG: sigma-70 family RNA polymerase sigma factor [Thermoanaerobaculia bacterium]